MPVVKKDQSLKAYNTFQIDVNASYFCIVSTEDELKSVIKEYGNMPRLILGGGSNVLFRGDFDGLIIKNEIKGIREISADAGSVLIEAGAGEVWDDLVAYAVEKNYGGLENLTLIPGSVGASPVQNIGAYGVEIKDVFDSLKGLNTETGQFDIFRKSDCKFGYRDSIFKRELKNKFIITHVIYRLSRNPSVNTTYDAIRNELLKSGNDNPGIREISSIVKSIRESKLPDPRITGNAGSFFKNPEITREEFDILSAEYPEMPGYPAAEGRIKVAAGWLIQKCGWKGKKSGNAGVYEKQALVLVNLGNASGKEIVELSEEIKKSVRDKFNINLETEVNII